LNAGSRQVIAAISSISAGNAESRPSFTSFRMNRWTST
jgi:hypothetical protein